MNAEQALAKGRSHTAQAVVRALIVVAVLAASWAITAQRTSPTARAQTASTPTLPTAEAVFGTATTEPVAVSKSGRELYEQHCAACHGVEGDGKGIAAPFLFPKPRDFRMGRFRLVSTTNRVPSAEDLHAVLVRGMPGSSMPPWQKLSDSERQLLVEEVQRLARDGVRRHYVDILKNDEGLTDEEIEANDVQDEINDFVESRTMPGPASDVPEFGEPPEAALARGKEIYFAQSCHSCHGNEGRGDGQQLMVDDEGFPTRPRDFTLGIFKGGHDPASLFRRTAYGMPGTPMPASPQLTPQQTADLVHYVRSMSTEDLRQQAILQRSQIVAHRVSKVPDAIDAELWKSIDPVALRMMPLWWRDDAHPDMQIQAVHDGQQLVVRLSWQDATANSSAVQSQAFEDAVALQLFAGPRHNEPFLGMGTRESPVDVWYWDADRQGQPVAVEDLYPHTVVDIYPFSEPQVDTAEADRPAARTANQPPISLPAVAAGNEIVPTRDQSAASSLSAGGLGSVTFRPRNSQFVIVKGRHNGERWTVVMTRSLSIDPDAGTVLEPGSKASLAVAVWDGSYAERDGRKSITIWQDLILDDNPAGGRSP